MAVSAADIRVMIERAKEQTREAMSLTNGVRDKLDHAITQYQAIQTDKPEIAEAIVALQSAKNRLDEMSVLASNSDNAADRYAVRL